MKIFFAGDTIFPNTKRTIQPEIVKMLGGSRVYFNLESVVLSKKPENSGTSWIAKLLGNYPVFSLSKNGKNFPKLNAFFFPF
ncbi:hypothetical protein LRY64_02840 [Candidatus Woesebacteria bacterium]|nr:hypothetical protein [Candidatus Woesebacteria bacterium]